MASILGRTAVNSRSVTSHWSRVSGMFEIRKRGQSDQMRQVRMADVFRSEVFRRRMAQSRMRLDRHEEKTKSIPYV